MNNVDYNNIFNGLIGLDKSTKCNEETFVNEFFKLFKGYFRVSPNDFCAQELLLNSLYVVYRKLCHSENVLYESLVTLYRLITAKRESCPLIQAFLTNTTLPGEMIENINIAQYFMNDYLNSQSPLFDRLSNFRAFTSILKTNNFYIKDNIHTN